MGTTKDAPENFLHAQVIGLITEYTKQKSIYDNAGLNANLKAEALQGMANALQLQAQAIANYSNYKYALSLTKEDVG